MIPLNTLLLDEVLPAGDWCQGEAYEAFQELLWAAREQSVWWPWAGWHLGGVIMLVAFRQPWQWERGGRSRIGPLLDAGPSP